MELSLNTLKRVLGSGEVEQVEDDALVGTEELTTIETNSQVRSKFRG